MKRRAQMLRVAIGVTLLAAAIVACDQGSAGSGQVRATERMTVNRIQHRGIDNALELTEGDVQMVLVPAWAGRISRLTFGGENLVLNDERVDGKVLTPDEGWFWWDGNATDFATGLGEDRQSQFKGIWLHPYPQVRVTTDRVSLISGPAPEAGLEVTKTYSLDGQHKAVLYDVTIRNTAQEARDWTVWERLLVSGQDAYAVAPVNVGGAYEQGWIERDGTENTPAENASTVDGYFVLRSGVDGGAGFAAELSDGWMAFVRGREVLLMTYPLDADGDYPHYDGANAIFYVSETNIELEPLSPAETLEPGEAMTFAQQWFGLTVPESIDPTDPAAVARWLGQQKRQLTAETPDRAGSDE